MRLKTQSATNWVLFIFTAVSAFGVCFYSLQVAEKETERLLATSAYAVSSDGYVIEKTGTTTKENQKPKTMNTAILKTNYGDIEITFNNATPKTVENFKKLVASGFYNGTRFHRVIKDFMIQGGDPLSKDLTKKDWWGTGGPGYTFEDEITQNDQMKRGDLAMANAGPGTNGSQFFIVTKEDGAAWLIGNHTIFGRVTKGLDVALKIENVPTEQPGALDRPVQEVLIKEIVLR